MWYYSDYTEVNRDDRNDIFVSSPYSISRCKLTIIVGAMNHLIEIIKPYDLNMITLLLVVLFAVPLAAGAFMKFTREGLRAALYSLLDYVVLMLAIFLSYYLTRRIFFDHRGDVFQRIYAWIPDNVRTMLYGQDVLIYLTFGTLMLLSILLITRPFIAVVYKSILTPLADALFSLLSKEGALLRGITGMLVKLPGAAFSVLLVSLALNFFVYYFPSTLLSRNMNNSAIYQVLYHEVLCPVLNSNLAKRIPVILNDAFAQTLEQVTVKSTDTGEIRIYDPNAPSSARGVVIEYFNGVTLDEAVQSNPQIDATALQIVATASNGREKAYLIYKWISANICYDYDKAAQLAVDPRGIDSGAIVAFTERKGVCFDYSTLYISMCRAAGIKTRLVTGQAYSGTAWGDHAWNQVYIPEEDQWVNVDSTFGSNANYFDKADFYADHRYAEIQGEW